MPDYLCLIRIPDSGEPPDSGLVDAYLGLIESAQRSGVLLAADPLAHPVEGRVVRVQAGRTVATDGPFSDSVEQIGGFFMLSCADIEEATAWALRIPDATRGSVEIREIMSLNQQ